MMSPWDLLAHNALTRLAEATIAPGSEASDAEIDGAIEFLSAGQPVSAKTIIEELPVDLLLELRRVLQRISAYRALGESERRIETGRRPQNVLAERALSSKAPSTGTGSTAHDEPDQASS